MKAVINKESFKDFFKLADRVTDDNSLLSIYLDVDNQLISLIIEGDGSYIEQSLAALVSASDSALVNYRLFKKIVGTSQANTTIEKANDRLRFSADRASYTLPLVKSLPVKPRNFDHWLALDAAALLYGISKAELSASSGFFDWRDTVSLSIGSRLRFFSSNGHRLYELDIENEQATDKDIKILLPKTSCRLITALGYFDKVSISRSHMSFYFDGLILCVPLAAAEAPQVTIDLIISRAEFKDKIAKVSAEHLASSIRKVDALITGKDFKRIQIDIAENLLMLSYQDKEDNSIECKDFISIEYDGDPFTYGINRVYLLEALSQLDNGILELKLPANIAYPLIITGSNSKATIAIQGMI
jgi:DNA polymerase III sliding clamp (beta) subunit (PCNA family)